MGARITCAGNTRPSEIRDNRSKINVVRVSRGRFTTVQIVGILREADSDKVPQIGKQDRGEQTGRVPFEKLVLRSGLFEATALRQLNPKMHGRAAIYVPK